MPQVMRLEDRRRLIRIAGGHIAGVTGATGVTTRCYAPDVTPVTPVTRAQSMAADSQSGQLEFSISGWSIEDWATYFQERAGIHEFSGGMPRPEAECRVLQDVLEKWRR